MPTTIAIPKSIIEAYNKPGRYYHNLDHISHMLSLIPSTHPHQRELTLATWFHDCVYDPQAQHGENERASIKLWQDYVKVEGKKDKISSDVCTFSCFYKAAMEAFFKTKNVSKCYRSGIRSFQGVRLT
jgi:predicted metal-dependent HD superfamily phosphohydrolase